jgi:hypothetical protein
MNNITPRAVRLCIECNNHFCTEPIPSIKDFLKKTEYFEKCRHIESNSGVTRLNQCEIFGSLATDNGRPYRHPKCIESEIK